MKENVSAEVIEHFLEGRDPQKYIVGIEANYIDRNVYLIINSPSKGKYIEKHRFKPFLWMKQEAANQLYGGNRGKVSKGMLKHGIKMKALKVSDDTGHIPDRLNTGFKYMVEGNKSYGELINFFREGGVDVFGPDKLFMTVPPGEQFLIQSGKRLYKGMDDYNDIHRFQFDLETTGLYADKGDRIFQIGLKDNRGYEEVIEVRVETEGKTEEEIKQSYIDEEIAAIITFFNIIDVLKPDTIAGYNSEFFDFDFFVKRAKVLGFDLASVVKTLDSESPFKRVKGTVKFGAETEYYEKTVMWGHNIIDISHAVRRAQAINSSIKGWGLKYITQFSGVAKPNRVYVPGDKIHTTWADTDADYAFNDVDGD
jgi:DNA polymerase elongation subunit (family B)